MTVPSFGDLLLIRVREELANEIDRVTERVVRDAALRLDKEIRDRVSQYVVNLAGWVNVIDRGSTIGIEVKMPPKGGRE